MGLIRRIVDNLPPPGNYMRELYWKGQMPAVQSLLEMEAKAQERELLKVMSEIAPIDEDVAKRQLKNIGITPTLGTTGVESAVLLSEIKINDRKLRDWFTGGKGELSQWTKQNFKLVNQVVQRGIFEGVETKTIASQIIRESGLAGFKGVKISGDTVAARIYRQAQTLARTAIAEQNHQINERVWKANEEAMKGVKYEWVAALDSRTCEICAPMDGRITDTREEQEDWPIHPNCRCQVIPFNENDPTDVNVQEISKAPFTYKGKTLDEMTKAERDVALSNGLYASKVKVNGESFYRKSKTIQTGQGRNRYVEYMAKANKETQDQFFGSPARADLFRREVERGADPQETLARMLRGPRDDRKWRRVSEGLRAKPKR
jgi:SPP1 gp7 family putative phage head morphogenesis protein